MARAWAVVAVALLGPPLLAALPGDPCLLQLLFCGLGAFVLWFVVAVERRPVESIGFRRPDRSTFAIAALALGIVLYVVPIITSLILLNSSPPEARDAVSRLAAFPAWFRVALAVSGGFIEELLYRGFAIERLTTLTGRRSLAAIISIVAFTLAHAPMWGLTYALAADFPFAVFMTLLYVWRRDLTANILTHSSALLVELLSLA